jgi:hypothetical protein
MIQTCVVMTTASWQWHVMCTHITLWRRETPDGVRIAENFLSDDIDYRKSSLISEIESSITSLKVTFFLVVSGGKWVVSRQWFNCNTTQLLKQLPSPCVDFP